MPHVYDLRELIGWTRRRGGDQVSKERTSVVADGTAYVSISSEDFVELLQLEVDGVVHPSGEYTIDEGTLKFDPVLDDGSDVYAVFNEARYSDDTILDFLADAGAAVAGDLPAVWEVIHASGLIDDDADQMLNHDGRVDDQIKQLIVVRAAFDMLGEKANSAADDAIMIKDGETTIDTSKGAGSINRRFDALSQEYALILRRVQANRFVGKAT